jgi:hypothetical protein
MTTQVTALFDDRFSAHAAVEQLVQAGFARDELSLLMSESTYTREFALKSGNGGVLGALVAGLTALGPSLMAAGPIVSVIATGGSLDSALATAGIPPHEAKEIAERLQKDGILAFVAATGDRAHLAGQLLELAGGRALMAA